MQLIMLLVIVISIYNCVLLSTDVKAHGSWRLLDELEDPELQTMASKPPVTIEQSCK